MALTPEVCQQITEKLGAKHIMLSYNWDIQDTVAAVYEYIESKGIPVWMDVKGGVTGNINAAMAKGVEGAMVICPFMTELYEESLSCEQELNYARDRRVDIIPCMAQGRGKQGQDYRASGWLGVITAGKLWMDFREVNPGQVQVQTDKLLVEVAAKLQIDTRPGFKPAQQRAAPKPATQPAGSQNSDSFQVACFIPHGGMWTVSGHSVQCGMAADIPIARDFFNEGAKRLAVFRPQNGNWYIKGAGFNNWANTPGNIVIQCGMSGDQPVPGDYDGDGTVSLVVWRPSNGVWYIKGPGNTHWGSSSGNRWIQCGMKGDIPVPMDYFNEGKLRMAVWRPSDGYWYIKGLGFQDWGKTQNNIRIQCGTRGDIPVPGDYLGDGKVRYAVWRPSNGNWYIKGPGNADWGASQGNIVVQCGCNGDVPVPYDFFGEGKLRIAVYRPSNGVWYVKGTGMSHWGSTTGNKTFQGPPPFDKQIPVNFFS